jgi:hypothetical protein
MENKIKLYKAIQSFQQEVPVILKDISGYNYKYADLPAIDEVVKPLLKKHNLGVLQPLTSLDGKPALKTIIYHTETGETVEEITPLPETSLQKVVSKKTTNGVTVEVEKYVVCGFEQMSKPQADGSTITYYRRYALSSFLGLITDKDTDGTSKSGNKQIDDLDL